MNGSSGPRRLNLIDLHRLTPGRRPCWRWELAHEIATPRRRMPTDNTDASLATAVDYLRRLRRAKRAGTAERAHPAMAAAHRLHQQDAPPRWEVESRLLAGEPSKRIAWYVGTSASVIELYHDLFFDVRDALSATDWICTCVLDLGPWPTNEPPESTTWAYWGWLAGPLMVDLLAGDHLNRAEPDWPDRAELANRARVCLQLHGTASHDYKAMARVLRAAKKIFPRTTVQRWRRDPMWQAHVAVIELAAKGQDRRAGVNCFTLAPPRPARRSRKHHHRRPRSASRRIYEQWRLAKAGSQRG